MAYIFKTIEEAEEYYEKNINSNSNNMNEEFEGAINTWVADNSHLIEEVDLENRDWANRNR